MSTFKVVLLKRSLNVGRKIFKILMFTTELFSGVLATNSPCSKKINTCCPFFSISYSVCDFLKIILLINYIYFISVVVVYVITQLLPLRLKDNKKVVEVKSVEKIAVGLNVRRCNQHRTSC